MKTAQSYLSQQIHQFFTDEAWVQFEAYLNNLYHQLDLQNISEQQIHLTFTGIEEYILGFVDELSGDSKITFRQAIDLIEDLGTPSEIINDLELPIDGTSTTSKEQVFCTECGSQIAKNLVYCNHCGRNTTLPDRQFSPFKQAIIDNPYGYSFGFVFGGTVLLATFAFIIGIIATGYGVSVSVSMDFGFIVLLTLVLSIVSSMIGWLIDEIYGEYKSFKQRYELIQGYFSSRRFLGHFVVVLGIMTYLLGGIFYRNSIINSPEGNVSAAIATMLLPLYLLTILSTEDYPGSQVLSYYQLLNHKSQLSRRVISLLMEFNKKTIMPLIIISGLWHFVIFQNFRTITAYAAIPGWFMFLILLLVSNGLYYAYLHTWRFLRSLSKSN